jgi:hypothetical protein
MILNIFLTLPINKKNPINIAVYGILQINPLPYFPCVLNFASTSFTASLLIVKFNIFSFI